MPNRLLSPLTEPVYAILRIVAGLMFSFHGMQKIFGILRDSTPPVGSQLWIGGLIELVGGLLIAGGLLTVWAAFIASGMMAVAYFQFHWKLSFGAELLPTVNRGELAVLYSLLFLYIACRGAGSGSLDRLRAESSPRTGG